MVAGETDGADLGEPYVGPLTFALPVDCTVAVEERRTESPAVEIEITYVLRFAAEAGGGAEVAMEDIEVGRFARDGAELPAAAVDPVLFERPSLVVDDAGEVLAVRGAEDLVARLPIEPAARPLVRQGLELDMTEKVWGVAFATWAAWGPIRAPEEQVVLDEGTAEERILTVTSVGTDGDLAVLRFDAAYGPDGVRAAATAAIPDLAAAFDEVDASLHDRAEVVVDPTTLRPDSVFSERVVEVDDGVEVQRRFERRTFRFDWASSTCD